MSIRHVNTNCTRLHRTEQNRAEQEQNKNRTEQSRAEQSRAEQNRADQSRTEQAEQSRARTEQEQNRTIFYDARKVETCLTYRYIQTYRDQYMLSHLEVSVYVYY